MRTSEQTERSRAVKAVQPLISSEMNEKIVREQRGGEDSPSSVSAKSATAAASASTASMTFASAALESHKTTTITTASSSPRTSGASASASSSSRSASAPASSSSQQEKQPMLNATDMRELREIKQLLWGDNVREDVFKRWSQGNHPSPHLPIPHAHSMHHHPLWGKSAPFLRSARLRPVGMGAFIFNLAQVMFIHIYSCFSNYNQLPFR